MMQLICNGIRLDLPSGAGLQFTHDNPLFAFDNLKCERTTNFKLPRTKTNDEVFALARIPAYNGVGMRRKFDAQLQDGAVVKDGYLYIDAYDGKDYNAIFVCGELVGLQRIKEVGNINETLMYDSRIAFDGSALYNANAVSIPDVAQVKYYQDAHILDTHCVPSFSVKKIVDDMCAQIGSAIDYSNLTYFEDVRLVNSGKLSLEDCKVRMTLEQEYDPQAGEDIPTINSFLGVVTHSWVRSQQWRAQAYRDAGGLEWDTSSATMYHDQLIPQYSIPWDCVLKFPADFPDNLFLVSGDLCYNTLTSGYRDLKFLGDYGFTGFEPAATWGIPLATKSVSIPANTPFLLIDVNGYKMPVPQTEGEYGIIGYDASLIQDYDLAVNIGIDHQWVFGEQVPYNALLPKCTLVELLKTIATINGKVLNYVNETLIFDDVDIDSMSNIEIEELTKKGEVKRTFSTYQQRNILQFKSPDNMPLLYKLENAYLIDNENLKAENVLLTMPFNETDIHYEYWLNMDGEIVLLEGAWVDNSKGEYELDGTAIMRTNDKVEHMLRVELPLNDGIVRLCKASTQLSVECSMTLLEYNQITSDTKLLVDHIEYVWTAKSWQKNIAKFTLAKV